MTTAYFFTALKYDLKQTDDFLEFLKAIRQPLRYAINNGRSTKYKDVKIAIYFHQPVFTLPHNCVPLIVTYSLST